ncbi:MAG: hypothetical protein WBB23_09135 [Desulforhopalus sp.]
MDPRHILSTGLTQCYNEDGDLVGCRGSSQDAEYMPCTGAKQCYDERGSVIPCDGRGSMDRF